MNTFKFLTRNVEGIKKIPQAASDGWILYISLQILIKRLDFSLE